MQTQKAQNCSVNPERIGIIVQKQKEQESSANLERIGNQPIKKIKERKKHQGSNVWKKFLARETFVVAVNKPVEKNRHKERAIDWTSLLCNQSSILLYICSHEHLNRINLTEKSSLHFIPTKYYLALAFAVAAANIPTLDIDYLKTQWEH